MEAIVLDRIPLRLEAGDVHWISSHANSSPGFDRKEARVVKQAFGEFAARIPVSSIKAILGIGAAGHGIVTRCARAQRVVASAQ